MGRDPDRELTQEQAERVWRRAAELQAAAAERVEERMRLAAGRTEAAPGDGLRLSDVRDAAVEAGIADEFVQLALAEADADATIRPGHGGRMDRLAERFLGHPPDAVEISRTILAAVETVYESMQRTFPNPPFGLSLVDTRGADLFVDGVLVFASAASLDSGFHWELNLGDVKQIFVMLRRGADAGSSELVLRAPLTRRRLNLGLGSTFTAMTGSGGAVAGGAVGSVIATGVGAGAIATIAAILAPAVYLGAVGAAVGVYGYRRAYRWGMKQARNALESLAQAIAVDVRTQGAFGRRAIPRPADDSFPQQP
ncbi:MAG: hypothetical protein L0271_19845 [Gemmatimonadetes bacterium]|nr:hypothetical protein [Gemmatimonadota bacterium]